MKYSMVSLILFVLPVSFGCTMNSGIYPVVISVETDRSEYLQSDTVFFKIYISNYGSCVARLPTHMSPAYDVFVYRNNEEVWHWMWGKYYYDWGQTFYIDPGDTLIFGEEYQIFWTQINYDSLTAQRGQYTAVAEFDTDSKMRSESYLFKLK